MLIHNVDRCRPQKERKWPKNNSTQLHVNDTLAARPPGSTADHILKGTRALLAHQLRDAWGQGTQFLAFLVGKRIPTSTL